MKGKINIFVETQTIPKSVKQNTREFFSSKLNFEKQVYVSPGADELSIQHKKNPGCTEQQYCT